jgi:alpha-glucosidase (family GH31 glycosyl hydrolase)
VGDVDSIVRDVYLPVGRWEDGNTGSLLTGPTWLRDYPATLFTLPYFIRFTLSTVNSLKKLFFSTNK